MFALEMDITSFCTTMLEFKYMSKDNLKWNGDVLSRKVLGKIRKVNFHYSCKTCYVIEHNRKLTHVFRKINV